jgi:hypothetical protein
MLELKFFSDNGPKNDHYSFVLLPQRSLETARQSARIHFFQKCRNQENFPEPELTSLLVQQSKQFVFEIGFNIRMSPIPSPSHFIGCI